ncbi:MAG: MFS transporter [Acidimicrobiales bacterium]
MAIAGRMRVLRERNFRLLWAGQTASLLGDQMTPVALAFAILGHGGNAAQLGVVLGTASALLVAFLLFGGVLADHFPRRRVMLGADIARFLGQGTVAALLISGHWHIWELLVTQAIWGTAAGLFNPAKIGLLPQTVSAEHLQEANAFQGLSWSIADIAGPVLSAVLVATVGAGMAMGVDSATFLVSALTLYRLRAPAMSERPPRTAVVSQLRAGWRAFSSRTWLWVVVIDAAAWHLVVYGPVVVLAAVVAKAHLGGAPAYGAIFAAFGFGSLTGGILTLHIRPRRPLFLATALLLPYAGVPALLAVAAPVPLIAIAAYGGGIGFSVFGILWDTTMQQKVPPELLSRVASYDQFGSMATLPMGYAIAGPVAAAIGVRATLWISASWMLLSTLAVLAVPAVRLLTAGADGEEGAQGQVSPAIE